jgi:hypothetical protein
MALAALLMFWAVGAVLLAAASRSAAEENRVRQAPTCSQSQLFTSADCQVTLDGTMTSLTSDLAEMDVSGHHTSAAVTISSQISDVAGLPVRVTFYLGEAIHVEGSLLKIDTDASPSTDHTNLRNGGMFFLIGGTILVIVNVLFGSFAKRDPGNGYGSGPGYLWR